jgi:hypothetical protein
LQPDQLVAELLARGDMNDDTTLELNRILSEWRAGTLPAEDEDYLRALHQRLTGAAPPAEAIAPAPEPSRLEGLTIEEWRDRALRAEADLAQIEEAARNG